MKQCARITPRFLSVSKTYSVNEANEHTPNTVNIFKRGIRLPGLFVVRLAATMPWQMQLWTVLGNTAFMLSDRGGLQLITGDNTYSLARRPQSNFNRECRTAYKP